MEFAHILTVSSKKVNPARNKCVNKIFSDNLLNFQPGQAGVDNLQK